jgi:hypothetical protein
MCRIDYGLIALHRSVLAERTLRDGSPEGRAELEALLREQPAR